METAHRRRIPVRGPRIAAIAAYLLTFACVAPVALAQQAEGETEPSAAAEPEAPGETPATEAEPGAATDNAELATVPVEVPVDPAPAAPGTTQLDDIVVTAQKKPQKEIDVPVSVSVLYDDFIASWGISNVREAMLFVPNVKVEQAGFFAAPRIRGFTINNNNKAIEPPAGIALDGIPYGRVEYFAAALFDIDRIEVLRGPQGTTFGKNTTAGLIHLISKDPTPLYEGYIDLQYGDYERQRIEGGVSGPLFGDLASFRLAGLSNSYQGFVTNTTADVAPGAYPRLRGDENSGVRGKLEFPDLWGSRLKLSYESVELVSLGTGVELLRLGETLKTTLLKYDPDTDFIPGNWIDSIDNPDSRITTIETLNGDWNLPLGGWDLVALASQSELKTALEIDVDFMPSPANWGLSHDRSPTTTFELRAASDAFAGLYGLERLFGLPLGHSDALIGVFSQRTGIDDSELRFGFPHAAYADVTAAAHADNNSDPATTPGLFGTAVPAGTLDPGGTDDVSQFFDSASDTLAVFGQAQWNFIPRWALLLGGRLSREEKQARWVQVFNSPDPNALLTAAGLEEFVAERQRTDETFQPKVSLNYQPWDDISLFVHWASAYKAGGFNAFAFRGEEDELVYDPEYSTEWGVDAKTMLFDRTLRLNVSLYRQDIDDFQVLTREPQDSTVGLGVSKVENAAKARAQGFEADLTWLAADWLRVIGTAGLNDTEYIEFPINDCPADKPNTDGDGEPRCDASGKPFALAPKWNGTLTGSVIPPFGFFGMDFSLAATAEYQSAQFLDIDLDDRKVQPAFWRYRASIGVNHPVQRWSFKLIGENLTNEVTYIRQGDVLPGVFVGAQEPPRQIYGQVRWSF